MPDGPEPSSAARWFRPDIDGLRAVAILLVLAFHARIPGLSGGFIGVDVFFVISGYLISRRLLDERRDHGRIDLVAFWCRRIRRLVPALCLVVVTTLIGLMAIGDRLMWGPWARDGGAAVLYVSNLVFAGEANDYFGANLDESPFLHTWSLGVEEQFYVVWPLLVAAVLVVRRGASAHDRRRRLVAVFATVAVASFLLSLWLSFRGSPWAFYGLPARAWEFAVAALLAAAPVPRISTQARSALVAAGLAAIGIAAVAIPAGVAYPGWWALAPVLGTAAVLFAGERDAAGPSPLTRLLAVAPAQWLGRLSYSWYLWHWPAIVLAVIAAEQDLLPVGAGEARLVGVAVSLPLAVAAHHLVENPIRFNAVLRGSSRRTLVLGAIATAVTVGTAAGMTAWSNTDLSPLAEQLRTARDEPRQYGCTDERISASGVEHCVSGSVGSPTRVLLVGDSHARHWQSALGDAAGLETIELADRWLGACPAIPVDINATVEKRDECDTFRSDTLRLIDDLRPDALILSQSNGYLPRIEGPDGPVPRPDRPALWGEAYGRFLDDVRARGIRVGVVLDNPALPADPLPCLSSAPDPTACDHDREAALSATAAVQDAERAELAERPGIPTFSATPTICPAERCRVVIDGIVVYADHAHLTERFTRSMVPQLRDLLRQVLGR